MRWPTVPWVNCSYSYDANDNKPAETITGVMSNYGFTTPSGYDDEDRLVAWEGDDAAQDLSWVLSDMGGWDAYTVNTLTQNRRAGAVHELTAIDGCHRPLMVPPLPRSSVDCAEDWIGGEGLKFLDAECESSHACGTRPSRSDHPRVHAHFLEHSCRFNDERRR